MTVQEDLLRQHVLQSAAGLCHLFSSSSLWVHGSPNVPQAKKGREEATVAKSRGLLRKAGAGCGPKATMGRQRDGTPRSAPLLSVALPPSLWQTPPEVSSEPPAALRRETMEGQPPDRETEPGGNSRTVGGYVLKQASKSRFGLSVRTRGQSRLGSVLDETARVPAGRIGIPALDGDASPRVRIRELGRTIAQTRNLGPWNAPA